MLETETLSAAYFVDNLVWRTILQRSLVYTQVISPPFDSLGVKPRHIGELRIGQAGFDKLGQHGMGYVQAILEKPGVGLKILGEPCFHCT
jgi:hypothetical protein